ncbi:hypothetical protein [Cupriavidus basilensis]
MSQLVTCDIPECGVRPVLVRVHSCRGEDVFLFEKILHSAAQEVPRIRGA